jgi:hypothetical protein
MKCDRKNVKARSVVLEHDATRMRAFLGALLPFIVVSALAGQTAVSADVEADLRRMMQELMDAIAPGQADVWRRCLHEKMLHVDENGIVRDKATLLKELTPLPAGLVGRIEVDKSRCATCSSPPAIPAPRSAAQVDAAIVSKNLEHFVNDAVRPSFTDTDRDDFVQPGVLWRRRLKERYRAEVVIGRGYLLAARDSLVDLRGGVAHTAIGH